MDKKLRNKTMAVLAGAVIASAAVNSNASERQPLQLEVKTEQSSLQYNANKDYVNPLVGNVIKAKRGEGNFIRTSYTSDSVNLSLSENNRLIASTEYKILYPLLYDQQIRPKVLMAITHDIKYGYFRSAEQFLDVVSEKARIERSRRAIQETYLAYTYLRDAMVRPVPNTVMDVNRRSAEWLSAVFLRDSELVREGNYQVTKEIAPIYQTVVLPDKQAYHSDKQKKEEERKRIEKDLLIPALKVYLSLLGIGVFFGYIGAKRGYKPKVKISEYTDNNETYSYRNEYSKKNSEEDSRVIRFSKDEPQCNDGWQDAIYWRAVERRCEMGTCGHPEHRD